MKRRTSEGEERLWAGLGAGSRDFGLCRCLGDLRDWGVRQERKRCKESIGDDLPRSRNLHIGNRPKSAL